MFITAMLIASVIVFLLSIALAWYVSVKHKGGRGLFRPVNILLFGVFLAGFMLYYSIYRADNSITLLGVLMNAIHDVLQLFTVDSSFETVYDGIEGLNSTVRYLYSTFFSLLYGLTPLLTFGFILSLLKNVSAYIRYWLRYFSDVYVFSELNERSLAFALNIQKTLEKRKKNKKEHPEETEEETYFNRSLHAAFVFLDVKEDNEEKISLIDRAESMGALMFQKGILSVKLGFHSKEKNLFFFLIKEDQAENTNHAVGLLESYGDRESTHVYVFSDSVESELLLNHVGELVVKDNKEVITLQAHVKRVNVISSLIHHTLYDTGKKIFERAVPSQDGDKVISAVVLGMGLYGTEMVKSLAWYGQMIGYKLYINAYDKDESAPSHFAALCPELMCEKYNSPKAEGQEDCYRIAIHSMDLASKEFVDHLKTLPEITYVFVCLGSDEKNLEAAVTMRTLCEQMGAHPLIQTVRYNTRDNEHFEKASNYRGEAYEIDLVGDMKSMYSDRMIIGSELEGKALERHLKWGDKEEFWKYEYNYRSSMAAAIHHELKKAIGVPGAELPPEERSPEERDAIRRLEHRRWNAYMRSEGFVYAPKRNMLAKQHHCLLPFDQLPQSEQEKDDD